MLNMCKTLFEYDYKNETMNIQNKYNCVIYNHKPQWLIFPLMLQLYGSYRPKICLGFLPKCKRTCTGMRKLRYLEENKCQSYFKAV